MMFRLLLLLWLGLCLPGADSGGIRACSGGTVMLPCDGPAATDTIIIWMFGGRPVCWFKNGSWCGTGHYVNRTWLGSIQQNNFSLVIKHLEKNDEGEYSCLVKDKKRTIYLFVEGGRNRSNAENTADGDPVCRQYREREDPPGSETKDEQVSDENPVGVSSGGSLAKGLGMTAVIVVAVAIGAALYTKRPWNQQRDKKPPDLGQSESALINGASELLQC